MAYDVRFLIEYSLPQDIAEVLSENLIALDPDSDDEGSPRRLIARAIESRLVDPTQPPIQLQDYANEQWVLERVLDHMATGKRREIVLLYRAILGARGESSPVLDRILAAD